MRVNNTNYNNQGGQRPAARIPTQEERQKLLIRKEKRRGTLLEKYEISDQVLEALLLAAINAGGVDLDARRFIVFFFGVNGQPCIHFPKLRLMFRLKSLEHVREIEERARALIDATYNRLKGTSVPTEPT